MTDRPADDPGAGAAADSAGGTGQIAPGPASVPVSTPAPAPVPTPRPRQPTRPHRVTLLPSGWAFDVNDGESVLEAGLRVGVVLPSSCRNGTCRSCLCRRLDGAVRYRVEWPGLSAEEKRDAWMLPCVAVPLTDLRIDAPRTRRLAEGASATATAASTATAATTATTATTATVAVVATARG